MTYRYVNTALESFCLVICLILLAYQFLYRKKKDSAGKWFAGMILSNIYLIIGDAADWVLSGVPGKLSGAVLFALAVCLYFAATGLLVYTCFGWVLSCIEQKRKLPSYWMKIGITLTTIQILIAVTMPIHKISFINEYNQYERSNLYFLAQLFPYLLYVMTIVILVIYRKSFDNKEYAYLACFVLLPLVAELIQTLTYYIATLSLAVTLSLIVTLMFIQGRRDRENEQKIQKAAEDEKQKLEELQTFQENFSDQLIDVICRTVESRDDYARGHSLRVAQYTREIMARLGGDELAQKEAYYVGILHDAGKIRVPKEIINKKGKLTEDEYEQIKLHTVAGYQILREIVAIPKLAEGAKWHHERYDGTGYPNGLAGEDIPLIARIIAVADAYDAMTSNRSHHQAMPQSVVRDEIQKGMGTQFDPEIARIMLEMMDEDMQYELRQTHINRAVEILLVDENPENHKLLKNIFVDENYILTSAFNTMEGRQCLENAKFDLCLLDLDLSDGNGPQMLEWIFKNVRKMKVIVLSGKKDREFMRRNQELGAGDYLTKPIIPGVLRESIQSMLLHINK